MEVQLGRNMSLVLVSRSIDWLIELSFYFPFDIKWVILEMLFPANLLATEQLPTLVAARRPSAAEDRSRKVPKHDFWHFRSSDQHMPMVVSFDFFLLDSTVTSPATCLKMYHSDDSEHKILKNEKESSWWKSMYMTTKNRNKWNTL